jgi:hypothetical protein
MGWSGREEKAPVTGAQATVRAFSRAQSRDSLKFSIDVKRLEAGDLADAR